MKGRRMYYATKKNLISLAIFASLSFPVSADTTEPKHSCVKPDHPGELASEARMKGFQKEVNDYRDCVNKFAQEQRAQAEAHTVAGNKAIEEFNAFVKTEMNPKKDK
jgi:hypothetical protein